MSCAGAHRLKLRGGKKDTGSANFMIGICKTCTERRTRLEFDLNMVILVIKLRTDERKHYC